MMYRLDMDLPLADLVEIFRKNEWVYASNGAYGVPNEDNLVSQIMQSVGELEKNDHDYINCGRIALIRDPEVNGTFHIALISGYIYNDAVEVFDD